jgi:lysophospholipase L1-like esterase
MPDSKPESGSKIVNITIVLSIAIAYAVIAYAVDKFSGSAGPGQWLNQNKIMQEHRVELREKVERDPHFKEVDREAYIREMEQIITMKQKRNLGNWVSYKSFTPNVKGQYVHTNDFGMRSSLSLREIAEKARANNQNGIRNVLLLGGSVAFGYGSTDDQQTISGFMNEILKDKKYEVFNLAQGGFNSYMDLFSLSAIGWQLEPDIIIAMEGYADVYHLGYESKGGNLAWGLWSGIEQEKKPEFALDFQYHNLEAICKLGAGPQRQVILALQPLSGFENDSPVENEKIDKMWDYYPKIRTLFETVAKNNHASFVDLSPLFKDESGAGINFFDKAHLTVTGQKKVAQALATAVIEVGSRSKSSPNAFTLRQKIIADILQ